MDISASTSATSQFFNNISFIKDLALPLLVTFLTYLGSQHLLKPVSKWREIRDELIIVLTQYANYEAYSFVDKDGNRKFDDRGMMNTVEQKLRRMAGEISTLPDYFIYGLWKWLMLPKEKVIDDIKGDLIGWANSLIERDGKYNAYRNLRIESLKKHLGLPNYYSQLKDAQDLELKRKG